MKSAKKMTGFALATSAAALFATASMSGCATQPGASGGGGQGAQTAAASSAEGHCKGVNACKGNSDCKSANHACQGQNACKGQGFVSLDEDTCERVGGEFEA